MAEAAGDADGSDVLFLVVPGGFYANYGVMLKEQDGVLGIVEINFLGLQQRDHGRGQLIGIHLQSHCQRLLRGQPWTGAAVLFAGDWLVQAKLSTPEGLIAEGVES